MSGSVIDEAGKGISPTIGRYEIRREIGRGTMGVVFEAHDPLLGRSVALKTIELTFGVSSHERSRFEKRFFGEARIAARLSHPGIVVVHDVGRDPESGRLFIGFELLQGRTLAETIADGGRLDWRRALEIARLIASALHHAHSQGVIHRDIKPANVFVLASGETKILDFGVAKLETGTLSTAGWSFGTPLYMSPEQVLGLRLDARTDQFSLGAVLYRLLSGRLAFDAPHATDVMNRVVHDEPLPPSEIVPDLPEAIDYVVARTLAKAPAGRYAHAEALAEDLEDVLDGRPPRHRAAWVPAQGVIVFPKPPETLADDAPDEVEDGSPVRGSSPGLSVWGQIGKYEIVKPLGEGALGRVYLARDTVLDRRVALKVLAVPLQDNPEERVRFEREAKAVARLNHPNLVTVFDLDRHLDGSPYLAMELIEGNDLQQAMRAGLAFEHRVEILLYVLAGLGHAHEAGIVHRDLKPANVLLSRDGVVKVTDFGVARLAALSSGRGTLTGTADYLSPEQVKGAELDGRSDLFAVGAMLFETISGAPPFHSESLMTTLYRIVHTEPDYSGWPSGPIPAALRPIVGKALAKDPALRYPTARDFARELQGAVAPPAARGLTARPSDDSPGTTVDLRRGSTPPDAPLPRQSRERRWRLGGWAAVGGAALLTVSVLRRDPSVRVVAPGSQGEEAPAEVRPLADSPTPRRERPPKPAARIWTLPTPIAAQSSMPHEAAGLPEHLPPAAALGPPERSFIAERTRAESRETRVREAVPEGFDETPPGVAVESGSGVTDLPGRIAFDTSSEAPRAGLPLRIRIAFSNEGSAPIPIRELVLTVSVNGRATRSAVTPLVKEVAPHQKDLLFEASEVWREDLTDWSLEVAVQTGRAETYTNRLIWK